jgi:hypothetical protein
MTPKKPARPAKARPRLRNDKALRRRLGRLVTERLATTVPGLSAHVGEDYVRSNDPEAAIYRQSGAHFRWVAFAFAPWRMWDLHVGVVAVDARSLSVGFHVSERAGKAFLPALRKLGAAIGAQAEHKPLAVEYQANLPPTAVAETDVESLADTIMDLCRRMAPAARKIKPPPAMRAG